jgi:hypothetical protein
MRGNERSCGGLGVWTPLLLHHSTNWPWPLRCAPFRISYVSRLRQSRKLIYVNIVHALPVMPGGKADAME